MLNFGLCELGLIGCFRCVLQSTTDVTCTMYGVVVQHARTVPSWVFMARDTSLLRTASVKFSVKSGENGWNLSLCCLVRMTGF
jgi:hypothetical protein